MICSLRTDQEHSPASPPILSPRSILVSVNTAFQPWLFTNGELPHLALWSNQTCGRGGESGFRVRMHNAWICRVGSAPASGLDEEHMT